MNTIQSSNSTSVLQKRMVSPQMLSRHEEYFMIELSLIVTVVQELLPTVVLTYKMLDFCLFCYIEALEIC